MFKTCQRRGHRFLPAVVRFVATLRLFSMLRRPAFGDWLMVRQPLSGRRVYHPQLLPCGFEQVLEEVAIQVDNIAFPHKIGPKHEVCGTSLFGG